MDIEKYWLQPPPEPSPGLRKWLKKIEGGWRPNSRISGMGYYEKAEFFQVYLWEWLHILEPMMSGRAQTA